MNLGRLKSCLGLARLVFPCSLVLLVVLTEEKLILKMAIDFSTDGAVGGKRYKNSLAGVLIRGMCSEKCIHF